MEWRRIRQSSMGEAARRRQDLRRLNGACSPRALPVLCKCAIQEGLSSCQQPALIGTAHKRLVLESLIRFTTVTAVCNGCDLSWSPRVHTAGTHRSNTPRASFWISPQRNFPHSVSCMGGSDVGHVTPL